MIRSTLNKIFSCVLVTAIVFSTIPKYSLNNVFAQETEQQEQIYEYTKKTETFTANYTGKYYVELYGASGGGADAVKGGYGGKLTGYINLYKGDTLYITCGEKGEINGNRTFNGGGAGGENTGAGGGATCITKSKGLLTNGEIKNYENKQEDIVAVAGGGGGKGSEQVDREDSIGGGGNWVFIDHSEGIKLGVPESYYNWDEDSQSYHNIRISSCGGAEFGQGNDYNKTILQGHGGAGGGGLRGGTYSGSGYYGGAGGSQYSTLYNGNTYTDEHEGNGKAVIKYVGKVKSTVSFLTKDICDIDGKTGYIEFEGNAGESITLPTPNMFDGMAFDSYELATGSGDVDGQKFTFGLSDAVLNIKYNARLTIRTDGYDNETQTVGLVYKQKDEYDKTYKLYQSVNGTDWYFAEFANDTQSTQNPTYYYGYTGGVQTFTSPANAIYTVTLNGAEGGGDENASGGRGGQTTGLVEVKKGETIYVVCGEMGYSFDRWGYNGGGYGRGQSAGYATAGGGATHIATKPGELRSFGNANNAKNYVIAVAGGGGGSSDSNPSGGGFGGGTNGGKGGGPYGGNGATQTSGYAFGYGQPAQPVQGAAGGGGWYGGYSVTISGVTGSGGGGGSGYIGSHLMSGKMKNGVNYGHGSASFTLFDTSTSDEYTNGISVKDIDAPLATDGIECVSGDKDKVIIKWNTGTDVGTTYYHKVISYDKKTNKQLQESDVIKDCITSGVKGYYYYTDNSPNGTANKTHTYTEDTQLTLSRTSGIYIHIAAVDHAGNLGKTSTYKYGGKYSIIYDLDGGKETQKNPNIYTGEMEDFDLYPPEKDGYIFIGWTGSNGDIPQKEVTIHPMTTFETLVYHANWVKVNTTRIEMDKNAYTKDYKTYYIKQGNHYTISSIGYTKDKQGNSYEEINYIVNVNRLRIKQSNKETLKYANKYYYNSENKNEGTEELNDLSYVEITNEENSRDNQLRMKSTMTFKVNEDNIWLDLYPQAYVEENNTTKGKSFDFEKTKMATVVSDGKEPIITTNTDKTSYETITITDKQAEGNNGSGVNKAKTKIYLVPRGYIYDETTINDVGYDLLNTNSVFTQNKLISRKDNDNETTYKVNYDFNIPEIRELLYKNKMDYIVITEDNVGNNNIYQEHVNIDIQVDGRITNIRNTNTPAKSEVFKSGESGYILINFTGTVNKVKVEFPDVILKSNPNLENYEYAIENPLDTIKINFLIDKNEEEIDYQNIIITAYDTVDNKEATDAVSLKIENKVKKELSTRIRLNE